MHPFGERVVMRARPTPVLLSVVVLALPLSGCLEGAMGPAPTAAAAPLVAYVDTFDERGNRTIVALRDDGTAERLTYASDGSWLPRLGPSLAYDAEDLATLFEPSSQHAVRGGLVHRIETGRVDAGLAGRLAPFLDGAWPAPTMPDEEIVPAWYRPIVLARVQDPPAVAEYAPYTEDAPDAESRRAKELHDLFDEIAGSFAADDVQEARIPYYDAWDGCLRANVSTPTQGVRVGEDVEVRAEVENCGDAPVVLDPAKCLEAPTALVQVGAGFVMVAALPAEDDPSRARAAYALDAHCRGDADPVTIPAGGSVTFVRRWNGSIGACRSLDDCEYRAAQPGEVGLFAFVSGQRDGGYASVTLLPRDGPKAPLLVVRETDTVNTTSDQHIEGDFGPHCAPVRYTSDPPAVTFWHYGEKPVPDHGVVVRDWRAGPHPERTMTVSADRLDVELVDANGTLLRSPFAGAAPFVEVRSEGDDFLVNGTRVGVGDTLTLEFREVLERPEETFEITSTLVFENLGPADVLYQRAGGCA